MAAKRKPDLKVVILGAAQVGKTSLIQRYLHGTFSNTVATIGASFFLKQWGPFHAAIWDTAGEEKYQSLQSFYCRNAGAAILAYDITNANSLRQLRQHYLELLTAVDKDCLCVVVGCKSDLLDGDDGRAVTTSLGKALAKEQNSGRRGEPPTIGGAKMTSWDCAFFETSAKSGDNVEEVFEFIREVVLGERARRSPDVTSSIRQPSLVEEQPQAAPPAKSGCCG